MTRALRFVAGVSALFVALTFTSIPAGAKKEPVGLQFLGRLPGTTGDEGRGFVVGIDDGRQLLYYMYRDGPNFHLREYDLRPEVPRLIRDEIMGVYQQLGINAFSPNTIQIDAVRRQMMVLADTAYGAMVRFIDLRTLKLVGQWDVGTVLPGFVAQGMTTSRSDNRIYLLGSQAGNAYATNNFAKPAHISMVVALDAGRAPEDPPEVVWRRAVPECTQVMNTSALGALIARSKRIAALYFACARANPYPGQSGIVRLGIEPAGDQAAAASFPVEFFPVSGSYTSANQGILGMAAFDYQRERFAIQSLSYTTPGVWVFDGRLSAWVGFVTSPDNTNYSFGFDPRSGHYYIGGLRGAHGTGYIVVTDVSRTPIPQGEEVAGIVVRGFIAVDPATRRLFVPVNLKEMGLYKGEETSMPTVLVLRDNTSIARPDRPLDYDQLTRDVDEGPGVITSFSGGAGGFGARVVLVGGYGGLVSFTGASPTLGPLRPGDRGLTAGRVPSIDLRPAGAAASAQALVPDNNTVGDLKDLVGAEWPWTAATCLDGGGASLGQDGSGPGGSAHVECDLSKNRVEAAASYGLIEAEGFSVASSSFASKAWRDPRKGVVTVSVAKAIGVQISTPAGSVSISRVISSVQTSAHGRPGTAMARLERKLVGIELTDPNGEVIQRVGECGGKEDASCREIIARMNDVLQTRLRIEIPKAEVTRTPRGAFAMVQQDAAGFLDGRTMNNQGSTFPGESASRPVPAVQLVFFNDSDEKSRLVLQLAAIQGNSIYTNTPYTEQPPPTEIRLRDMGAGAGIGSGSASGPNLESDLASPQTLDSGASANAAPVDASFASNPVEGALAFLRRSPGEALLFAGIWSMFIAALGALVRRRSLLSVLTGGN